VIVAEENMEVKNKRRGRPSEGNNKLSRESILFAARAWILQETKTLSMRALASRLEVDPMALYHYFDNKAALLEAVAISIMQDIYVPDASNEDWQLELKKLCQSYLSQLSNHPGLLESLLSMGKMGRGPAEVFTDRFNMAISSLAIKAETKKAALDLIADYLHGFALAIRCSGDDFKPDINDIEMPLVLYFSSLQLASDKDNP
jgi:AcrR family transcriptional regulator